MRHAIREERSTRALHSQANQFQVSLSPAWNRSEEVDHDVRASTPCGPNAEDLGLVSRRINRSLQTPGLVATRHRGVLDREVHEPLWQTTSDAHKTPEVSAVGLGASSHEIASVRRFQRPPAPPIETDRSRWIEDRQSFDLTRLAPARESLHQLLDKIGCRELRRPSYPSIPADLMEAQGFEMGGTGLRVQLDGARVTLVQHAAPQRGSDQRCAERAHTEQEVPPRFPLHV